MASASLYPRIVRYRNINPPYRKKDYNGRYQSRKACVYGGDLKESLSIQMDQQVQANCSTPREGSKVGLELDGHVIPTQIKDGSMVLRILDKVHTVSDAE